jgi:hypothetical protein
MMGRGIEGGEGRGRGSLGLCVILCRVPRVLPPRLSRSRARAVSSARLTSPPSTRRSPGRSGCVARVVRRATGFLQRRCLARVRQLHASASLPWAVSGAALTRRVVPSRRGLRRRGVVRGGRCTGLLLSSRRTARAYAPPCPSVHHPDHPFAAHDPSLPAAPAAAAPPPRRRTRGRASRRWRRCSPRRRRSTTSAAL